MKTFKDLEFKPHPLYDGFLAKINFENGYGASVCRTGCKDAGFYLSYTDNENEWELAVLRNGKICHDTNITDDVLGHLSEVDVSGIMILIQKLKKVEEFL